LRKNEVYKISCGREEKMTSFAISIGYELDFVTARDLAQTNFLGDTREIARLR